MSNIRLIARLDIKGPNLIKGIRFDEGALTQTGVVAGTPLYMSPEQASDGEIDRRSDIYSLGATFYTLLTGKAPFTGDAAPQIMFKHVTAPTPDPRDLVPEIPEPVVQILRRAMEKSPADRFQSAEEMREALDQIVVATPRRQYAFLVEHEPSLLMMKRPLRGPLIFCLRRISRQASMAASRCGPLPGGWPYRRRRCRAWPNDWSGVVCSNARAPVASN